jgi:FMN phosphatase YigB (HAD superfamily)
MKKLIVLDLDNTLFNPAKFREEIFLSLATLFNKQNDQAFLPQCQEIYDALMRQYGVFDPKVFITNLMEKTQQTVKLDICLDIIFSSKVLENSIHHDAANALTDFNKLGDVILFSQGEKNMQEAKIASIRHFFNEVHILDDKKGAMKGLFDRYTKEKIYFVDDMLPMLREATLTNKSIVTIWIRRGRHAQTIVSLPDFLPTTVVDTLTQAVAFVKNDTAIDY